MNLSAEGQFAVELAKRAGQMMRENFTIGMKKEWKSDDTPLTVTDLAINQMVIDAVTETYPNHGVVAEEGSAPLNGEEYVWVCDPIDGTVPFSHGYPTFVFSLALTQNGAPILGVIYDPILDRMAVAEKGKGAFLNEAPMRVSSADTFMNKLAHLDISEEYARLRDLLEKQGAYTPTMYSCVYPSMLVASGELVSEVYTYSKPWDAAAVKIIVEEAGGTVTDLEGNEQRYDRTINGFVATNGMLHKEVLELIQQAKNL